MPVSCAFSARVSSTCAEASHIRPPSVDLPVKLALTYSCYWQSEEGLRLESILLNIFQDGVEEPEVPVYPFSQCY